jgi:hypothetical protein
VYPELGRCTIVAEPCPTHDTLLNTLLYGCYLQLALTSVPHSFKFFMYPKTVLVCHFKQVTVHLLIPFI